MGSHGLSTADNLFDFFHEQVDTALDTTGADVSEEGVFYLAQLLTERGRVPAANRPETLVELQMEATFGERAGSVRAWRELGDQALYTVGFFRRSIHRRNLDPAYYSDMGAGAYQRLARMLRAPRGMVIGGGRGMDDIFAELAACFDACAEVLQEVRSTSRAQVEDASDGAVLALYEEWLETGSRAAAQRLQALGVLPMRPGGEDPGAC